MQGTLTILLFCAITRVINLSTARSAIEPVVGHVLSQHRPMVIVNFAAETHVDHSIEEPAAFMSDLLLGRLAKMKPKLRKKSTGSREC
jgi:dTDP-D-glucose 4,6-dehydratase